MTPQSIIGQSLAALLTKTKLTHQTGTLDSNVEIYLCPHQTNTKKFDINYKFWQLMLIRGKTNFWRKSNVHKIKFIQSCREKNSHYFRRNTVFSHVKTTNNITIKTCDPNLDTLHGTHSCPPDQRLRQPVPTTIPNSPLIAPSAFWRPKCFKFENPALPIPWL